VGLSGGPLREVERSAIGVAFFLRAWHDLRGLRLASGGRLQGASIGSGPRGLGGLGRGWLEAAKGRLVVIARVVIADNL
jgi:hypothetical protein